MLSRPAQAVAAWQLSPLIRLVLVAALLSAGKVLLYTAGTTLFLSRQGIDALPVLYLTLAVIAVCVSLLLAAVIDRAAPAWLLPGLALVVAVAVTALLFGLALDWQLVPAAILVAAHVYDIVTDIVFWLLAAALLDNLRLRRHTPRLFIAIAAGGTVAGIIAERALATVAIEHLLWPVIGLVCLAVALFGKAAIGLRAAAEADWSDVGHRVETSARRGLTELRQFLARHPFALCLALNSLLLTTVYSLTEFVAYAIYSETIRDEVELGRLLALLFAALQLAELAVLWFGAHGMVERAGPMLRNLLFPLTSLACLLALLLQPRLGWAILAHINTEAVSNGVFEPVNATNYGALPIRVHGRARTLADGIFYPVGMAFAGLVLTFLPAQDAIFRATLLALIAALFFVALNVVIARSYLPTLLRQLRHGVAAKDRLPKKRAPTSYTAEELARLLGGRRKNERRLGIELIEAAADCRGTAMPASIVPPLISMAPRLDDEEWVRVAQLLGHLGSQRLAAELAKAIDSKEPERIELVATAQFLADLPMQNLGAAAAPGSFVAALLSLAVDRPRGDAAVPALHEWLGNQAVRNRVATVLRAGSARVLRRIVEQPLLVQQRELKTAMLAALARLPADAAPGTLHPFIDDLRSSPLPQQRAAALRLMAQSIASGYADESEAAADARFRSLLGLAWPALADPNRTVRAAAIDVLQQEPKRAIARIADRGRLTDPALPADRARGLIELLASIGDRPARRLLRQLIATLATGAERDAVLLQRLARNGDPELAPLRAAVLDHAQRLTELLFAGLAALGDGKRAGQLSEALREVDARLRAGTIDGLASLRHGVLARRFIPLLEQLHLETGQGSDALGEPSTRAELLALLATTGDRWLRAAVTLVRAGSAAKSNGHATETTIMQPMLGPKGPALTDSSALAGMLRLKQFELFAEVPLDVLESLLHLLEDRQFASGAVLQPAGQPLLHAWLVDTGGVTATWPGGSRETFGPEGCVGETALIDPAIVAPEIVATSQCRVLRLHRVAFQDLAREHPVLIESLCRVLARSLTRQRSAEGRARRRGSQPPGSSESLPSSPLPDLRANALER